MIWVLVIEVCLAIFASLLFLIFSSLFFILFRKVTYTWSSTSSVSHSVMTASSSA
jgi:hypothetical protein